MKITQLQSPCYLFWADPDPSEEIQKMFILAFKATPNCTFSRKFYSTMPPPAYYSHFFTSALMQLFIYRFTA